MGWYECFAHSRSSHPLTSFQWGCSAICRWSLFWNATSFIWNWRLIAHLIYIWLRHIDESTSKSNFAIGGGDCTHFTTLSLIHNKNIFFLYALHYAESCFFYYSQASSDGTQTRQTRTNKHISLLFTIQTKHNCDQFYLLSFENCDVQLTGSIGRCDANVLSQRQLKSQSLSLN